MRLSLPHGARSHACQSGDSKLSRAVDVGQRVFDGHDCDDASVVVDAVDHPVVARRALCDPSGRAWATCRPGAGACGQGAVDRPRRPRSRLSPAAWSAPRRTRRSRRRRRVLRRWPEMIRRARSLVSTCALPSLISARLSRISASRPALSMTSSVFQGTRVLDADKDGRRMLVAVITTRPCSRSRRSTTSESRFLTINEKASAPGSTWLLV